MRIATLGGPSACPKPDSVSCPLLIRTRISASEALLRKIIHTVQYYIRYFLQTTQYLLVDFNSSHRVPLVLVPKSWSIME